MKILTFGIFDLFHTGHLNLLEKAKDQGDILIVGVGSDYSVSAEPKKKMKTVIPSEQRVRIINSLKCVDWAFIYGTYYDLEQAIRYIKPDLYVRGDDWIGDFPGKKVLDELKIPIKLLNYTNGISSTSIKERIKNVKNNA
jgi:rfaE bifunctional protein nucleotidyltransferase chain/domain